MGLSLTGTFHPRNGESKPLLLHRQSVQVEADVCLRIDANVSATTNSTSKRALSKGSSRPQT